MYRKLGQTPYILHPLEAVAIVGSMTNDEDALCAAVLHDTVEDTSVTMEDILDNFGPETARIVAAETEDKRAELPPTETWTIRKTEFFEKLKNEDIKSKMVCLGDKLSNMHSFYRYWLKDGDAFWNNFNQKDPKKQAWYYSTAAELLSELKDYPAWQEYDRLVKIVFEKHL